MKKSLLIIANLLIISTLSFAQNLPSTEAILDKYLTAIGGKEAVAKIVDLTINSTAEMGQMTMETESKYKLPNKFRQSTYMMGNETRLSISDGTKVYNKQAGFGNRPEQTDTKEGKDAQAEILSNNPFAEMYYADNKITGTVVGIEKVDRNDAYKVDFVSPEGKKWTTFYDLTSGLKVKRMEIQKTPRGENMSNVLYSNFKDVNGIKMPFVITRSFGERTFKMEIQSIKANKGLKEGDFVIK